MKLHIHEDPISDIVKIYMEHNEAGSRYFVEYGPDCIMTRQEMKDNEFKEPKPFMTLRRDIFEDMLKQMVQYGTSKGIETEKERRWKRQIDT